MGSAAPAAAAAGAAAPAPHRRGQSMQAPRVLPPPTASPPVTPLMPVPSTDREAALRSPTNPRTLELQVWGRSRVKQQQVGWARPWPAAPVQPAGQGTPPAWDGRPRRPQPLHTHGAHRRAIRSSPVQCTARQSAQPGAAPRPRPLGALGVDGQAPAQQRLDGAGRGQVLRRRVEAGQHVVVQDRSELLGIGIEAVHRAPQAGQCRLEGLRRRRLR
jgi:hypothetical protein